MPKQKLSVETLKVESFSTGAVTENARATSPSTITIPIATMTISMMICNQ